MGSGQSTPVPEDQVFFPETPIQFSEEVVSQLADGSPSSGPSAARQSSLDSHVRSRIQDELARLRQEEEHVRQQIEQALEKENLDREREGTTEDSLSDGNVHLAGNKNSGVLMSDLEDLRQKVDRYQKRRDHSNDSELQAKATAVVDCYRSKSSATLDCWQEVDAFKVSVAALEQHYVSSLR